MQRIGAEVAFRDPDDHLNVAHSPRSLFDVRFQVVGGIVKLVVAGALLGPFGFEKFSTGPQLDGAGGAAHMLEEPRISHDETRLHEVGRHGYVLFRLAHAILYAAHALSDFETDIPEKSDERLDLPAQVRPLTCQYQQVDIGGGMQLATAVTAHGDERESFVDGEIVGVPSLRQQRVDEDGALVNQSACRHALAKSPGKGAARADQHLAVGFHGLVSIEVLRRRDCQIGQQLGVRRVVSATHDSVVT